MKTFKIFFALGAILCIAIFAGVVFNSGLGVFESGGLTLGFAGLLGSLEITKETGTSGKVVFDSAFEDIPGGATLYQARLKSGTTDISIGALLYVADGIAQLIKTALVVAGGNATGIRVAKNHQFIVGEFVMRNASSAAMPITTITTTETDYDTITIGTTLGSTPSAGDILVEATAQSDAASAAKYTANAILKNDTNVERANSLCSCVVRGSVREDALPYSAHALDKAALSLFRFV